jgi:hypothetical protein
MKDGVYLSYIRLALKLAHSEALNQGMKGGVTGLADYFWKSDLIRHGRKTISACRD